ncbi:MAG: beta-glucosidase [Saprospiraceae bacterium]|nr:beta-glucosidase [Saprospiraceae bacterium]
MNSYTTIYSLRLTIWTIVGAVVLAGCQQKVKPVLVQASVTEEDRLMDQLQQQCLDYIWKGGEEQSGAARERIHTDGDYPQDDSDVVTSGGTGFGIMAIVAGIERKFIDRDSAVARLEQLVSWLEKADRWHGVWPHWMYPSGKTKPFSRFDDGGDLVETAYLAQGLITARQYFATGNAREKALAAKMNKLWEEIDWNFYTKGKDVLYWHWSPNVGWQMNFAVKGYNECLIMYILAASSKTHGIKAEVYHKGFMRNGEIVTDKVYYGLPTVLDHFDSDDKAVGPLFWAHYSYLGLNPKGLKDKYANFWDLNRNHALIHYRHCSENPNGYKGYSDECWGLTSSYSMVGYAGHCPQEDLGVISPTAALSSFPYTPEESMKFLKFLYLKHPEIVGKYGPYDAFSFQSDWMKPHYLAIDQLPIVSMVENYRSGLLWKLFMSAPEIQAGLKKLEFTSFQQ